MNSKVIMDEKTCGVQSAQNGFDIKKKNIKLHKKNE